MPISDQEAEIQRTISEWASRLRLTAGDEYGIIDVLNILALAYSRVCKTSNKEHNQRRGTDGIIEIAFRTQLIMVLTTAQWQREALSLTKSIIIIWELPVVVDTCKSSLRTGDWVGMNRYVRSVYLLPKSSVFIRSFTFTRTSSNSISRTLFRWYAYTYMSLFKVREAFAGQPRLEYSAPDETTIRSLMHMHGVVLTKLESVIRQLG
jgi:hypothetical protein